MDLQQQFSAEVAKFLASSKMKPAAFGRAALGDPSFVSELERGRAPNLRTIEKVRSFMRDFEGAS